MRRNCPVANRWKDIRAFKNICSALEKLKVMKNCYCQRHKPILFFTLLFLIIFYLFQVGLNLAFTVTDISASFGWCLTSLAATLIVFISSYSLFPSAILSISTRSSSDGTSSKGSLESVLFDGRTIPLGSDLPQQFRLFFWKKGEYKVYVMYTVESDRKLKYESGTINLYEDRHIEIEVPIEIEISIPKDKAVDPN